MTTTMPTPYDEEIARARADARQWPSERSTRELRTVKDQAEGYRRAKVEDAPLVEALKDLTALYASTTGSDPHFVEKGRTAIAVYEGRTL